MGPKYKTQIKTKRARIIISEFKKKIKIIRPTTFESISDETEIIKCPVKKQEKKLWKHVIFKLPWRPTNQT